MQSPCPSAKGVCQKPLALSYGYQPIGKKLHLTIQDSPSPYLHRISTELPFSATVFNDSLSLIPYLEVKANEPFLFSGVRIKTDQEYALQEFKVEYSKNHMTDKFMVPLVPPGHNTTVSFIINTWKIWCLHKLSLSRFTMFSMVCLKANLFKETSFGPHQCSPTCLGSCLSMLMRCAHLNLTFSDKQAWIDTV